MNSFEMLIELVDLSNLCPDQIVRVIEKNSTRLHQSLPDVLGHLRTEDLFNNAAFQGFI
jgi:hypothetical protein